MRSTTLVHSAPLKKCQKSWSDVIEYVEKLVAQNKSQNVILNYLARDFNIKWSKRTLGRFCKKNNIVRYDKYLSPQDVMEKIQEEASGCARRLGYRMMWQRLRRKGFLVKRDQVALCMKFLGLENPLPTEKRKHKHCYISKGPNYTWHVDGNDKLIQWGFFVHGAIDGYSRKILWLNIFVTNKDPWLIGKFYIETVEAFNTCPCRVQCDRGTENSLIGKCQMFLRRNHSDDFAGPRSYFESSSHINQPIEAFWRHYREAGIQYWIDHFKKLKEDGKWDPGNSVHQLALLYVYMPILKAELNDIKDDWNCHRIRLQKKTDRPNGVPDELYDFPEQTGGENLGKPVCAADVAFISDKFEFNQSLEYLPFSFRQQADEIMHNLAINIDINSAEQAYQSLVEHFD